MNLYQVSIKKELAQPPQLGDPIPYIQKRYVAANTFKEVCEAYPNAKKIKDLGTLEMIGQPINCTKCH